jgi:hypothetical protein
MSYADIKTLLVFLGVTILMYPWEKDSGSGLIYTDTNRESSSAFINKVERVKTDGYRTIIKYEDGFLAAGSGGRIDRISISGKILKSEKFPGEDFNCIISDNQTLIAGGDRGTIMISSDKGMFRKTDSSTDKNINSLTLFNGTIIAATDGGEIIAGDGRGFFRKYHLALKGNIVSVSARRTDCYGVTDKGEIIHSVDGINWEIFDFNKIYSGFYRPCYFSKVLVTENRIAVAGVSNDGSPVLMFSNQGNVWTERTLIYTDDQGIKGFLLDFPNDIFYDDSEDQYFLACNNGKLMKLPSCSQCNIMEVLSDIDLTGISCNENAMMIIGENYYIKTVILR